MLWVKVSINDDCVKLHRSIITCDSTPMKSTQSIRQTLKTNKIEHHWPPVTFRMVENPISRHLKRTTRFDLGNFSRTAVPGGRHRNGVSMVEFHNDHTCMWRTTLIWSRASWKNPTLRKSNLYVYLYTTPYTLSHKMYIKTDDIIFTV